MPAVATTIVIDEEVEAGYIYLTTRPLKVHRTVPITETVLADLDADGRLLGVEILNLEEEIPVAKVQEMLNPEPEILEALRRVDIQAARHRA